MTHSTTQLGLFLSLGITVAVLGVAISMALRGRRRAHVGWVIAFLAAFLVTLFFAESHGRHYRFGQPSAAIHLTIAFATALGTAAPLFTGYRYLRDRGSRVAHRRAVVLWLVGVLAAVGTGAWMLGAGERLMP